MRKVLLLAILILFLGAGFSFPETVPDNSFRIKARGKLNLFGIPVSVKVRAPNLKINLKTYTTPGIDRTTGTKMEFDTRGRYIDLGQNAQFDAMDAVLPTRWEFKVDPFQKLCSDSDSFIKYVETQKLYKVRCNYNIERQLSISPSIINRSWGRNHPVTMRGEDRKGAGLFKGKRKIIASFYRKLGESNFEKVGETTVSSVKLDGKTTNFEFPIANLGNSALGQFAVMLSTKNIEDVYLAHGEFFLNYGFTY